jgi:hypothetical protein
MASFCTKCGAPLASTTGFCTSCGTPIAAPAPAPVPSGFSEVSVPQPVVPATVPVYTPTPAAGYAPVAAAPAYTQAAPSAYPAAAAVPVTMAPAAGGGGSALKIILIIVAVVIALFVVAGAVFSYGVWKVAHSVHLNHDGKDATLSIPGAGTFSAGDSSASAADLGVPVYPGATREKGGMDMNMGGTSMHMAHFSTEDSVDQVTDFYKGKMGSDTVAISTNGGKGSVLQTGSSASDRIMVTIAPGSGNDDGKTTIVIMHSKK